MIDETLVKISSAYVALLSIPMDHEFRWKNQRIYATLRDYIAEHTGCSAEVVQTEHEDILHTTEVVSMLKIERDPDDYTRLTDDRNRTIGWRCPLCRACAPWLTKLVHMTDCEIS